MPRVLVAVCEPVAALGLAAILGESEDLECLPLPDDPGGDVRALVAERDPDVLLLDVTLRRADRDLIPDLIRTRPDLRILVYIDHTPEECAVRHLMELGGRARLSPEALARLDDCCFTSLRQRAHGCVGTGASPDMIVHAVRTALAGEVAAAPWLAALTSVVGAAAVGISGAAPKPISERELEVMTLLAEGMSNKLIARRLGIHEQTVKNHVTRLLEKLGAESRLEVGLLAARHNLRLSEEV